MSKKKQFSPSDKVPELIWAISDDKFRDGAVVVVNYSKGFELCLGVSNFKLHISAKSAMGLHPPFQHKKKARPAYI